VGWAANYAVEAKFLGIVGTKGVDGILREGDHSGIRLDFVGGEITEGGVEGSAEQPAFRLGNEDALQSSGPENEGWYRPLNCSRGNCEGRGGVVSQKDKVRCKVKSSETSQ